MWARNRLGIKGANSKDPENHLLPDTLPQSSMLGKKKENSYSYEYESGYQELKRRIHDKLLDDLDLAILDELDSTSQRQEISKVVEEKISQENTPLNLLEKEALTRDVLNEVLGYGPLETFLQDAHVSDILVNTHKQVYIEKFGKLELTKARFKDDGHLRKIIDKIVSKVGRRIDESSPMVDARLEDGSRVNAIIPPLSIDGPVLSIRRFGAEPLRMATLIENCALTKEIAEMLEMCVRSRLNVVISGGT